jgi:hypothetical protein
VIRRRQRRVQQRDRAAVAVADQQRRAQIERRQHRRQHDLRFTMQVVGAARLRQGDDCP